MNSGPGFAGKKEEEGTSQYGYSIIVLRIGSGMDKGRCGRGRGRG